MSAAANPIFNTLSMLANELSRRALDTDPAMSEQLRAMADRTVELHVKSPAITMHLRVRSDAIEVFPGPTERPDAIVSGDMTSLIGWLLPGDSRGQVLIEGDEQLLHKLQQVLRSFRPDPGEPLANLFGEQAASTLLGTAEMGLSGLKSVLEGLGRSASEQASQRFMARQGLEPLLQGIDELRLRVDRLAAGIAQLERARQGDQH